MGPLSHGWFECVRRSLCLLAARHTTITTSADCNYHLKTTQWCAHACQTYPMTLQTSSRSCLFGPWLAAYTIYDIVYVDVIFVNRNAQRFSINNSINIFRFIFWNNIVTNLNVTLKIKRNCPMIYKPLVIIWKFYWML